MFYFIFDLDHTLANLYSVYYFLLSLRIKQHIQEYHIPISHQDQYDLDDISPHLDKAYDLFVQRILADELSPHHPLGILRPGILPIMKHIHHLKNKGTIKHVLIYSNNSSLYCLEFIKDIIQSYVKSDRLLSDLVHWYHPMREEEISSSPNYVGKDWNTLRDILIKSQPIQASDPISPSQIYFFDDMNHISLSDSLQTHYVKVPPYTYKASIEKITMIYKSVIYDTSVDIHQLLHFLLYIFPNDSFINSNHIPLSSILYLFERNTERTANYNERPPSHKFDYGITLIRRALKDVEKKNVKMEKLGGGIKNRRKHHSTHKKKRYTLRK